MHGDLRMHLGIDSSTDHPICFLQLLLYFQLTFTHILKLKRSIFIDFSLTVMAATLIFISWRGSAILSA